MKELNELTNTEVNTLIAKVLEVVIPLMRDNGTSLHFTMRTVAIRYPNRFNKVWEGNDKRALVEFCISHLREQLMYQNQ
jgi:hypothetical protein